MNLWLVPVDERSFQETLAEPADLAGWSDRPESFPQAARVWGIRTDPEQGTWERNRRNLERMESGDMLLIYRNSESRYTATGRVGPMAHTEWVRDEYWNGGPALDVFVVEDYDRTEIDRETVNQLLGYKESFWPQGLWRVSDDRPVDRVVRRFEPWIGIREASDRVNHQSGIPVNNREMCNFARAKEARLPGGHMAWESLAAAAVLLAGRATGLERSPAPGGPVREDRS